MSLWSSFRASLSPAPIPAAAPQPPVPFRAPARPRRTEEEKRDLRFGMGMLRLARAANRWGHESSERLQEAREWVGPVASEYCRALSLTDTRFPCLTEGDFENLARCAVFRAEFEARAKTDFAGWDSGREALRKRQAQARSRAEPPPSDLLIPDAVEEGIRAMHEEAKRRLEERGRYGTRKAGGGNGGASSSGGPVLEPSAGPKV